MRGNPTDIEATDDGPGSIPASAGEPANSCEQPTLRQVYPRECGGTITKRRGQSPSIGLSPRVRGNHSRAVDAPDRGRSIPASAGEPAFCRTLPEDAMVYPRECGGTRVTGRSGGAREGSIPASAGEPPIFATAVAAGTVYPRECGGTSRCPRVNTSCIWSIPASAGEPHADVYP